MEYMNSNEELVIKKLTYKTKLIVEYSVYCKYNMYVIALVVKKLKEMSYKNQSMGLILFIYGSK
jgi:hypothetical protein